MSQSGTTNTSVIPVVNRYPITPYVVGSVGEAGYQTIQDGLDAANAAGGGIVGVQPGTYTENLTLYDNTQVVGFCSPGTVNAGAGGNEPVIITGTHSPPTSGFFAFKNVVFTSAGSVISSASAGSATLQIEGCVIGTISGYLFNVDNWAGEISIVNTQDKFTSNRGIFNSAGSAIVYVINSEFGSRSASSSTFSGTLYFWRSNINVPISLTDGTTLEALTCTFYDEITMTGDSEAFFYTCNLTNTGGSCLTYNSGINSELINCLVNSDTNPSIAGSGAGSLRMVGVDFVDDDNIAGTLTVSSNSSYSGTYKSDYTNHGVILGQGAATNMVATTAGSNGEVLIGANNADPAFAAITSTAGSLTVSGGANTLNLDIANYATTTFTPTLSFGGGSTGITYSTNEGRYTRMGNLVYYYLFIQLTSKGSSTGNALISGFPVSTFTGQNYTNAIGGFGPINLTAGYTIPSVRNLSATTTADVLMSSTGGGGFSFVDDTMFTDTTLLTCQGFYFV